MLHPVLKHNVDELLHCVKSDSQTINFSLDFPILTFELAVL